IGPRARSIENYQRRLFQGPHNFREIRDMSREAREVGLDRLLVADVGEHAVKNGDGTSITCGNEQAGLGHQGQQPYGFESDGLATGVGTRDDDTPLPWRDLHVDGYHLAMGCNQQWMARLVQLHPIFAYPGFYRAPPLGEDCTGI